MRNQALHRSICLLLDIYSLELAAPSNVVFLCKMAVQRGMLSRRAGMQNEASARACPLWHRVHGLVENPHLHGMLSHHCSLHSLVASSLLAFLSQLGVTVQPHPEGIALLQVNFDS